MARRKKVSSTEKIEVKFPILAHAIDQLAVAMMEETDVDHGEAVVTLGVGHEFKITLDVTPAEGDEDER